MTAQKKTAIRRRELEIAKVQTALTDVSLVESYDLAASDLATGQYPGGRWGLVHAFRQSFVDVKSYFLACGMENDFVDVIFNLKTCAFCVKRRRNVSGELFLQKVFDFIFGFNSGSFSIYLRDKEGFLYKFSSVLNHNSEVAGFPAFKNASRYFDLLIYAIPIRADVEEDPVLSIDHREQKQDQFLPKVDESFKKNRDYQNIVEANIVLLNKIKSQNNVKPSKIVNIDIRSTFSNKEAALKARSFVLNFLDVPSDVMVRAHKIDRGQEEVDCLISLERQLDVFEVSRYEYALSLAAKEFGGGQVSWGFFV